MQVLHVLSTWMTRNVKSRYPCYRDYQSWLGGLNLRAIL